MKTHLIKKFLEGVTKILGMVDRNKASETYGCMDRQYWHYKKFTFPSGMYQLGCLALAYAYKYEMEGLNPWYKNERIKELCIASIRYMRKSAHKDGMADEFYPYERAIGASSFPLYAATESYMELELDDPQMVIFFKKRADWLIKNNEPNVIANHQFGTALALLKVFYITDDHKYAKAANEKIELGLSWGNEEGWFQEYDGCDPGYMTFTIDFLAKIYEIQKGRRLGDKIFPVLKKAVTFCSYFQHPDGSYAGEYGSRNTSHYLPCGFEIFGKEDPIGLQMNDKSYKGSILEKQEYMEDDTYFFYNVLNYFQTYLKYREERPQHIERSDFVKHFKKAQLIVVQKEGLYAVISLAKGGVCKIYKGKHHIYSDAGFVGHTTKNQKITSQIINKNKVTIYEKPLEIKVTGQMNTYTQPLPTPLKQAIFHTGMAIIGPWYKLGKLVKDVLVKKLITRRKPTKIIFDRTFTFYAGKFKIKNEIHLTGQEKIRDLYLGNGFSVIHVPTSRYYQESVLGPWRILTKEEIQRLNIEKRVRFTIEDESDKV